MDERELRGIEPFEIEATGAQAGVNPMFGEWRQRFDFAPVPHRGGGGPARRAFQDRIHDALTNRFVYWGEVQVTITLFLDVQAILETSETADVDNYAKAILDALKGPDGIIVDDTQVQALTISWIDSHTTYFEVEIRSSPDDFMIKPVTFFEMPDGLYYPQPATIWEVAGPKASTDLDHFVGLTISEMMAGGKRHMRHVLRQAGLTRLEASRNSVHIQTQLRGFHRSRLVDSGFDMVPIADWRRQRTAWAEGEPEKARFLTEVADKYRGSVERLAAAAAALGRPRS
ncbi:RusA family crossover junction endodeoxyribonuclease [Bradyrhizobium sp. 33ap4]|uniref:RusA family crossover junction endodeoxyribonuclease n=1 Tax=Bradyrhizobium sp. 33ap4 TaxID=3061630 RepID=UPI002931258F|nr:RusA family crossover junction endodeoxyribonuclease [Bradyrhizobium sp. 33ap4]